MVSEDFPSRYRSESFLLITRTPRIFTAARSCDHAASTWRYSGFPAYSQILLTELQASQFYSYGRRLPGLRFGALHSKPC